MLPGYLADIGMPFHIVEQDTYSVVKRVIAEGKTTCSICSRLRRGVLYRVASELGATKSSTSTTTPQPNDDLAEALRRIACGLGHVGPDFKRTASAARAEKLAKLALEAL